MIKISELDPGDVLAGKCSGSGCCLASSSAEDLFAVDELVEPDTLAGKCSGSGCCLAYSELDEE